MQEYDRNGTAEDGSDFIGRSLRALDGLQEARYKRSEKTQTPLPEAPSVRLQLSRSQVERVVSEAADSGSVGALLWGSDDVSTALEAASRDFDDARLSRSLMVGLVVLSCFPLDGNWIANAQIASRMGLSPTTCHRYVSTLLAARLIERDPTTRRYRLVRMPRRGNLRGGATGGRWEAAEDDGRPYGG